MGTFIRLLAADGHDFDAYVANPVRSKTADGTAQDGGGAGAVVVIQEIFGINQHIRDVTDRFAAAGYLAIAPALFDRAGGGIELGYDADGVAKGRALKDDVDAHSANDVMAAITYAAGHDDTAGKVVIVGFCWGGSLAWRMACASDNAGLVGAVSYYGGALVGPHNQAVAHCPVMAHFGLNDASIPEAGAREFTASQQAVKSYFYDADHGFNCDQRGQYDAASAGLAWERTTAFLQRHLRTDIGAPNERP